MRMSGALFTRRRIVYGQQLPVGQRKTGADLKPVLTMADATANLKAGAFVRIWLETAKFSVTVSEAPAKL